MGDRFPRGKRKMSRTWDIWWLEENSEGGIRFVASSDSSPSAKAFVRVCFSPLAGIRFVASRYPNIYAIRVKGCFSPLAGIRFVASLANRFAL